MKVDILNNKIINNRIINNRLINNRIINKYRLILFFILVFKRYDILRYIYYFKNFVRYEDKLKYFKNYTYKFIYSLPFIKNKVEKEVNLFNANMKNEIKKNQENMFNLIEFNIDENGMTKQKIFDKLNDLKTSYTKNKQLISGTIYNKNDEEIELLKKIIPFFFKSNPLHPELFPQVSFLEKTIIKSVAKLFNGNEEVCGCVTSGGTESIILACYSFKNHGLKRGIKYPEIIAPVSIHAAFDKACNYFGIILHKIPINLDNSLDFNILESYINNNTVGLACSCPSYAHGLVDDIEEFSNISIKYNLLLHVDVCLGGFLVPFIENIDFKFDFLLPGVSSISADTHKYGYCPKGSSIILYRNSELFKNQIFVQSEWNGGIYATPTIPGSRSGNNIVITWAFLNYYGINFYKKNTKLIIETLNKIKDKTYDIEGLDIIGNPKINVIAYKSDIFNIYNLNSEMKKYGWELNELQNPSSIHFCITLNNIEENIINKFCENLKYCANIVRGKKNQNSGSSIYGSTQKVKNKNIVEDLAREYIKNLSN